MRFLHGNQFLHSLYKKPISLQFLASILPLFITMILSALSIDFKQCEMIITVLSFMSVLALRFFPLCNSCPQKTEFSNK